MPENEMCQCQACGQLHRPRHPSPLGIRGPAWSLAPRSEFEILDFNIRFGVNLDVHPDGLFVYHRSGHRFWAPTGSGRERFYTALVLWLATGPAFDGKITDHGRPWSTPDEGQWKDHPVPMLSSGAA